MGAGGAASGGDGGFQDKPKRSQLSKKKDSNKADAILIASFYYETYKIED